MYRGLLLPASRGRFGRGKRNPRWSSKKPTVGRLDDLQCIGQATYRRSFFHSTIGHKIHPSKSA
ncbi:hypothetical protein HMPREF1556_00464 [Porphyromonas sp. oral taxon 278 str. W7784]|nr:hypothetical protein HMPREF1556_00464 [Porphyromonas sp. oral taxon 278 str. W7784]